MNNVIKEYQDILENKFPTDFDKYLKVPEFERLKGIGYFCGADFCPNIYQFSFYYSTFDHSLSTAKIVWHFTNDRKATIAALLHDMASPVFRHAIDFMNGDAQNQESTEEFTERVILSSKELITCLKNDKINVNDVIDYKLYPIADNERPKLSADRLEGLFASNLVWLKTLSLEEITELYNDIIIGTNEFNEIEMTFKNKIMAKRFVAEVGKLSNKLDENEDILAMNMLAKITKLAMEENQLVTKDLYKMTEMKLINLINHSNKTELRILWETFATMSRVERATTLEEVQGFHIVNDNNVKKRLIDPLVVNNGIIERITEADYSVKTNLKKVLEYKDTKYAYVPLKK